MVKPIKRIIGIEKKYLHGDGYCDEYYNHGSQTRKADSNLATKLEQVNLTNFNYMNKKWGEGWRQCSPFKTPFNCESNDISLTTFDLDFVRQKNLGDYLMRNK